MAGWVELRKLFCQMVKGDFYPGETQDWTGKKGQQKNIAQSKKKGGGSLQNYIKEIKKTQARGWMAKKVWGKKRVHKWFIVVIKKAGWTRAAWSGSHSFVEERERQFTPLGGKPKEANNIKERKRGNRSCGMEKKKQLWRHGCSVRSEEPRWKKKIP